MHKHIIAILITFTSLTGCAVVESERLLSTETPSEGIVYYLPMRPMKIEVVREEVATQPALEQAKSDVATAVTALSAAKKALDTARQLQSKAMTRSKWHEAGQVVSAAQADVDYAEKELAAMRTRLSEAQAMHLDALNGQPQFQDTVSLTALPFMADTRYRYAATLNHAFTRSDDLDLKTSAAGLLTNSTAKANDQSAQILVSLAQSVAAAGMAPAFPSLPPNTFMVATEIPLAAEPNICGEKFTRPKNLAAKPFRFEYVFDPTADKIVQTWHSGRETRNEAISPWEYIEGSLCALGADLHFEWQPLGAQIEAPPQNSATRPGLFYRRQIPYRLDTYSGQRTIAEGKTGWSKLQHIKSIQFELPNNSPAEFLEIKGAVFANREFTYEFQDGMLTSSKVVEPSEAMTVAKIPYDIIKAAIAIPAEILSVKVNYTSAEKSLVAAETELLNAQTAYKKAQEAPAE